MVELILFFREFYTIIDLFLMILLTYLENIPKYCLELSYNVQDFTWKPNSLKAIDSQVWS